VPAKIILSWYSASAADTPFMQPVERWRLVVRLQRPHGNANPHGFDYEAWLLEQGVRSTGCLHPTDRHNQRPTTWTPNARYAVERARGWLRSCILTVLDGKPYAGVTGAGDWRPPRHRSGVVGRVQPGQHQPFGLNRVTMNT